MTERRRDEFPPGREVGRDADPRVPRRRRRTMIERLTRLLLIAAGALVGLTVAGLIPWTQQYGFSEAFVIIIFIILGSAIGYVMGGIVGREIEAAYRVLEDRLSEVAVTDIALGVVGVVVGLVAAALVTIPLRFVGQPMVNLGISVTVYVALAYTGLRVALVKRADVRRAFPRLDPSREDVAAVETVEAPAMVPKYLDTSAVIDGRFVELMRAGLLEGPVRVPRFVLAELQTLSDSADDTKRARGRRGLDLLEALRGGDHPVDVFEIDYPEQPKVDEKLMRLASEGVGVMVTTDFNLTKVARVQGLTVVNINEVASALRPVLLPGEALQVRLVREGKEAGQGVGYLEDGTMVVVQDGGSRVGSDVGAVVTSVLQTAAGRMIFARPQP
jgi:uncharacterized protein YacL